MKRTGEPLLTLEVSGPLPIGLPETERRKVFGAEGGTIGRAVTNHWILDDGYVSGSHACIRYEGGRFFIEDTSSNGVYLNDQRLDKGRPHPVVSGDRLFIDPFEIVASIAPSPDASVASAVSNVVPIPVAGEEVDPLRLLGLVPDNPSSAEQMRARKFEDLSRDLLKEHRPVPVVALPPAPIPKRIPENYDPLPPNKPVVEDERTPEGSGTERRLATRRRARDRRTDAPRAQAEPPFKGGGGKAAPAPEGDRGVDLATVLAGAGLEGAAVTPELAAQFGQILRVVVAGVLDVLQARQKTKEEFRISRTVIRRAGNNPLKHSVDVEDALHNLLLKRNPAYLGPVEAFEDAFNDMRNHQLAMLAGVRVAFEAMFGHFDPARLQSEFDRHTPRARKGALAALQGKPDYWEFYRDWVRRMADDADGSFRTLFGEEFARAYEDQLDRLRAPTPGQRRGRSKGAHE